MAIFTRKFFYYFFACLFSMSIMLPAYGLDPEPRRWNYLPLDTNFIGAAYIYTEADILVDPMLLIEDTKMEINTLGHCCPVNIVLLRYDRLIAEASRVISSTGDMKLVPSIIEVIPSPSGRRPG